MEATRALSYTEAIAEAFVQAMECDGNVFLMGEGVDNVTGVYGTVLPAFRKFGPSRVIDTPLSENGLTGIAIGAALDGLRPVLVHQRNDFMLLTMDQLVNHAAKIPFVSAGRHRVPLTIVSFIARKVGEGVQHSQSLQALFAHVPGLTVAMPATPADAKGMLLSATSGDDPTILLFHRTLFEEREPVPESLYKTPFGTGAVRREGHNVTVAAVSAAVNDALKAARALAGECSVEVLDLRSVKPLDRALVAQSVAKTGRLVVVDTGWPSFGVAAEVIASVAERAFSSLTAPPQRVCMRETPAPAAPFLLSDYHPNAERIMATIRSLMT